MAMLKLIPTPWLIGIGLALLAGSFGSGFYYGAASRQDTIDKGVKALITCQALTEAQNAAVRRLKAEGDDQKEKILKAQREAEELRQRPPVKRAPPPSDCAGAMTWGKARAEELSKQWR